MRQEIPGEVPAEANEIARALVTASIVGDIPSVAQIVSDLDDGMAGWVAVALAGHAAGLATAAALGLEMDTLAFWQACCERNAL